ncbi:tyrosine-type recombinase/integrase [Glaciecola sp. HTCC2999]|uniref:tyrosine-type recombinase/integrase n=1 Tax=Glaciecola sp. HTCC2999 TaxID=455436 RepID=UPI0000E0F60E|nr:tyrosine-type recombinase/integrase [Glaciecola sp. HTCC2999]
MIEELFTKLNGAMAKNTIRAYRSDYNDYAKWCLREGVEPLNEKPQQMYAYIENLAHTCCTATINRRIACLSSIFKFLGLKDTTKDTDIYLLMKKIRRQKGSAQTQAEPLTKDLIDKLWGFCGMGLKRDRNHILLLLGHQTMRRRSELCQFRFEDIKVLPGQRYGIQLRFSKTDQMGRGKTLPITSELYEMLKQWQAKVGNGLILRGIIRNKFITESLAPSSVNRILQEIQAKSDIHTEVKLSGHSFRVGGALDLLMQGTPIEKIMLRGGWHSESSVIRYLQSWDMME